jgi:hypothetical protein
MERVIPGLGDQYPESSKPVWVSIFDDFSGRSFPSLRALKSDYSSYTWKKIK